MRVSAEQKERVVAAYKSNFDSTIQACTVTLTDLGKRFGLSVTAVTKCLEEAGVYRPKPRRGAKAKVAA